jgi:CheY-like chemotaxis protein
LHTSEDDLKSLAGTRVLIVEDEMLVSMLVEDILADLGCVVIGPMSKIDKALEAARSESFDIAFLDVNLAGQRVFPVADVLAERGIPFIFVSGYGDQALEPPHNDRPVVKKPFAPDALGVALVATLGK